MRIGDLDDVESGRALLSTLLAVVSAGCSTGLPSKQDVPAALYFQYPESHRIGEWTEGEAKSEPDIDAGGDFSPFTIIGSSQLEHPIAVGALFDWFLEGADDLGLDGCDLNPPYRLKEGEYLTNADYQTESVTGFKGSVRLTVSGGSQFDESTCVEKYELWISMGPGAARNIVGLESTKPTGANYPTCTPMPGRPVSTDEGSQGRPGAEVSFSQPHRLRPRSTHHRRVPAMRWRRGRDVDRVAASDRRGLRPPRCRPYW